MRAALLATALLGTTAPAMAQNLVLGAGYADFSHVLSEDGGVASVEYQHDPFYRNGQFEFGWGGSATVHGTGDVFLGAGFIGTYQFQNDWFIETSVMPGAFFENDARNDLGSTFEIRSLAGFGYRFNNGGAVSLALTHKSNASTATTNPGVNTLLLRWHMPLQGRSG